MKHTLIAILLLILAPVLYPQVVLTIEGEEFIDMTTGRYPGVVIPREEPTIFTFRNNSITSVNAEGYMLQAGDETPGETNNNLKGEVITGNRFIWNGIDVDSWTHSVFTGYNTDVILKYNYLSSTPNGIQRKSDGMTDNAGVVAYNIIKNPKVGIVVKGMNGIRIFNNTLYSDKTSSQTYRALIDIHTNTDGGLNAPSKGTKIFNNIFYTRNRVLNIWIYEVACLEDFESDYNVFWCESGEPVFKVEDKYKSFSQWQAMGYDLHSVVINPEFTNLEDFVPAERLDFGINLGDEFRTGLATDALWGTTDPKTVDQDDTWQVGARVYETEIDNEELPANVTLIYPNPAMGFINIVLTDMNRQFDTMSLLDYTGRLIFKCKVEFGRNEIQIPKYISGGLYSIILEADQIEKYIRKIIILNNGN